MHSLDLILARVHNDPITHLSCRSLFALEGYILGYDHACRVWSLPQPHCEIDRNELLKWLRNQVEVTAEHADRLNTFNWLNIMPWAHFLSLDDREAFDTYFTLRAQAPRLPVQEMPEHPVDPSPEPVASLLDAFKPIRERPGMYFGNEPRPVQIWSFCSGFFWAEQDRCLQPSLAEPLFTSFPIWLTERYPFSQAVPWHRLFNALALGSPMRAFDCFLEHLELFLSGKPSDTCDPTMQLILDNILKAHGIDPEKN